MPESTNNVATTCLAYNTMAQRWVLLHDLMGGTQAMRNAGATWLPKETDEKAANYQNRLARSILFGALGDTIEKLASKPFTKPVTLQGQFPDQLVGIEQDVDGLGTSLTQFGKDLFVACVTYGLAHVLVDYPQTPADVDLGTERQLALRPRFILVTPPNLIGWTTSKDDGGTLKLTSVRIRETETRTDGPYGQKLVNLIRVYNEATWELWEQIGKDWICTTSGAHSFPGIPLATCYFTQDGFMTATPPLEDLAWLNLAHWQSMSDQRNILRFTRFALLFGKGFTKAEVDKGLALGPNQLISSTSIEADLKYVEHSGAAIAAGERDLKSLEERMEMLGMQPLIRQSGDVKATGQAIAESKSQSQIQAWIRNEEAALRQAFVMAAMWVKQKLSGDFKIDVFSDFSIAMGASNETDQLLRACQAGKISDATYLMEVRRRGLLSETLNTDEEQDRIKAQGPTLAGIGFGGDAADNAGAGA